MAKYLRIIITNKKLKKLQVTAYWFYAGQWKRIRQLEFY